MQYILSWAVPGPLNKARIWAIQVSGVRAGSVYLLQLLKTALVSWRCLLQGDYCCENTAGCLVVESWVLDAGFRAVDRVH